MLRFEVWLTLRLRGRGARTLDFEYGREVVDAALGAAESEKSKSETEPCSLPE